MGGRPRGDSQVELGEFVCVSASFPYITKLVRLSLKVWRDASALFLNRNPSIPEIERQRKFGLCKL